MRLLLLLPVALGLLACGGSSADGAPDPAPQTEDRQFSIALPNGREVRVPADQTVYVVLTSVGAGDAAVVYAAANLPTFALLSGDYLAISPTRLDVGTYDVTLTAWVGAQSDSKVVRIIVEATNRPPEQAMGAWLSDATTVPNGPTTMIQGDATGIPCMLPLRFRGMMQDLDRDRTRVEVEVVPHGAQRTGTPTQTTAWENPEGHDATYFLWNFELTGLQPGVPVDIAYRSVDEPGAGSPWFTLAENLSCGPIGLRVPYLEVYSGETQTYELELLGTGDAAYTLTAHDLPAFASLSGKTLTLTAPTVTSVRTYQVGFTLASGGYTYRADDKTIYLRP